MTEETATAPAIESTETAPIETPADPPSAGGDTSEPLADALSATYDEIQGRDSADDDAPSDAPAKPDSEDTPTSDDPQGEPATDQPGNETDKPSDQGHDQTAIALPNSWSADIQQKWDALPRDMQQQIADRERQSHEQITRQGEALATYEPIRQVFEKFPQYQSANTGQFVGNLVAAQAYLDSDPVAGIKWLADTYKVDLGALNGQSDGDYEGEDLFRDPRVDQLQQDLQQSRQQIQQLTGHLSSQQQQQQVELHTEATKTIEAFKADKPYWDNLQASIHQEVAFVKQAEPNLNMKMTLDKAYQRALNNSDVVRAKIEEDAKAKQIADAEKKAAEANRKAKSNIKANSSSSPVKDASWDDDSVLGATYDRLMAG